MKGENRMKEKISKIKQNALEEISNIQENLKGAELENALKTLNEIKVKYLGKKGELTSVLRGMGALAPEERPVIGSLVNEVREEINQSNVELVKKLLNVATQIGDHPYLKQKGLTRYEDYPLYELSSKYVDRIYNKRSLRESRVILAPLQDIHGTIRTVQFINETGKKFFIKGGMKGCFFLTKELKSAEIIGIAEGVATALSVSQVQGFPVVAAMSCCNLKNIAQIIKEHYPKAELIILADKGGNGEKMAKEAARQTSSRVAVPEFTDEEVDKFKKQTGKEPNDFNDYYLVRGEL